MNKKYFIFFICFIIFITVTFTGITIFSKTDKNNVKDKIESEMGYIETKLLGMINSLNNISFSNSILLEQSTTKEQSDTSNNESSNSSQQSQSGSSDKSSGSSSNSSEKSSDGSSNNSKNEEYTKYKVQSQNILINSETEIDWDYLKNTVQTLYTSWPTIMMDLHSANIKNENILTFSNTLDELIVNIQKEDKVATLNNLAILYSFIPIYKEQYSNDADKINIAYTKSCVINSYALLENDKWDDIQAQISKAQEYFGLIINSVNEDKNQASVSKTYILINEMNNVINIKDKKLFYLKYINLMENAMNI